MCILSVGQQVIGFRHQASGFTFFGCGLRSFRRDFADRADLREAIYSDVVVREFGR
jgi:hypothetical protein